MRAFLIAPKRRASHRATKAAIHHAFFQPFLPGLSGQGFGFGEWPVFGASAVLGLGLDHLVEAAASKDREELLRAGIFSVALLGIQPQTHDVPISLRDQLQPRFGRGGVADLRRIPEVDMQHRENVGLVVLGRRAWGSTFSSQVTTRACAQGERESQDQAFDSTAGGNRMTAHGTWRPAANGADFCVLSDGVVIKLAAR